MKKLFVVLFVLAFATLARAETIDQFQDVTPDVTATTRVPVQDPNNPTHTEATTANGIVNAGFKAPITETLKAPGFESSAPDGEHFYAPVNTNDHTAPQEGYMWYNQTLHQYRYFDSVNTLIVQSGIPTFRRGSPTLGINSLSDTTSTGEATDPIDITITESTGTCVTNAGALAEYYYRLPTSVIGGNVIFDVDTVQNMHIVPSVGRALYFKAYDQTDFVKLANDQVVSINNSPALGDRVFAQARLIGATIHWFVWSDCDSVVAGTVVSYPDK